MEEKLLFRDFINPHVVTKLAERISAVHPAFQKDEFCKNIIPNLAALGLKQRAELICNKLYEYLPKDYEHSIQIMLQSLPHELSSDKVEDYGRFIIWAQTMYVYQYGLHDFDLSMKAMYEMTKRFTSEFAIRHFIDKYPDKSLQLLHIWAKDPNVHVRRLVSEGTRPRLPWGLKLNRFVNDPLPIIPLLEKLYYDPELYVRRSVANNLNDISKDHPDLVIKLLKKWRSERPSKNLEYIVQHATRTLIKKGNADALILMGNAETIQILPPLLKTDNQVANGGYLNFEFVLKSQSSHTQTLTIDYAIHYLKANGSNSAKVFKLKKIELLPHQSLSIHKKHSFKPVTTRVYYPGKHYISLIINGKDFEKHDFMLT
ncbi:MAG: DNA alkylation repair protein [Cytophagales bacterium]|nr:DNA alkylation repair protein [Cytophagales bacterium]